MRFEDWPQRLEEVFVAARARQFQYGQFDCALFAADCVHAITGVDYASALRGYESKLAAYRIVKQYGSLEAMITSLLGKEPIHPAHAQRGDVVLASTDLAAGEEGDAIGVVAGVRILCPCGNGLRSFPRSAARLAWRIE
jgi:hypothetical protein